jgi:hypothetical protein
MISAGDAVPAGKQLAGYAHGHRLSAFVEYIDARVLVFAMGRPIGTLLPISLDALMTWQHVKVVFSVGPYPFMSCLSSLKVSRYLRTCGTDSASPPASSCRTPFNRASW